jgi:hypothetical protein
LESALVAAWRRFGVLPEASPRPRLKQVGLIAVVSGSGSVVTHDLVASAERDGLGAIKLEAPRLLAGPRERDGAIARHPSKPNLSCPEEQAHQLCLAMGGGLREDVEHMRF